MNKLIIILATVASAVSSMAETNEQVTADQVVAEAMKFIQEEGWTASDVADAIRSVRALYVRENATKEGRERWNGKIVKTVVNTNDWTKTTYYENGEIFVDSALTPQQRVARENAKLKTEVTTTGIPKKLAEARLRRQAEKEAVSNVTVNVTAGGER